MPMEEALYSGRFKSCITVHVLQRTIEFFFFALYFSDAIFESTLSAYDFSRAKIKRIQSCLKLFRVSKRF